MTHFPNISNKVKDAKNKMDKAQQPLHIAHKNPTLCMRERDAIHKYASTVRAEESFFKQKARIQWLSLGDQNTSYFHKSVNGRQIEISFYHLQGRMKRLSKDTRQSNQK
jgi:hypothetical protein